MQSFLNYTENNNNIIIIIFMSDSFHSFYIVTILTENNKRKKKTFLNLYIYIYYLIFIIFIKQNHFIKDMGSAWFTLSLTWSEHERCESQKEFTIHVHLWQAPQGTCQFVSINSYISMNLSHLKARHDGMLACLASVGDLEHGLCITERTCYCSH